jgi:hypothetical protein
MKLLRTTALTAALMTAAVPLLTSEAQAWRWRGAGWRAAAVGAAVVGSAIAARSYYGYGYGYPAYGYGYGAGYGYPAYGYGYGTGFGYAANSYVRPIPVTATRLTATAMAPALSAAVSMPPLGVVGAKKPD